MIRITTPRNLVSFPTHVGMNRIPDWVPTYGGKFPHTRGDEPLMSLPVELVLVSFPTHVGMNRSIIRSKGR